MLKACQFRCKGTTLEQSTRPRWRRQGRREVWRAEALTQTADTRVNDLPSSLCPFSFSVHATPQHSSEGTPSHTHPALRAPHSSAHSPNSMKPRQIKTKEFPQVAQLLVMHFKMFIFGPSITCSLPPLFFHSFLVTLPPPLRLQPHSARSPRLHHPPPIPTVHLTKNRQARRLTGTRQPCRSFDIALSNRR